MSAAAAAARPPSFNALLTAAAAVAAAFVVWQLVKALRGIGDGAKDALDAVTQPIADAYVDFRHPGIDLAEGIHYLLPSGSLVGADAVTPSGGGAFRYAGVEYRAVAALGNGVYRAERA